MLFKQKVFGLTVITGLFLFILALFFLKADLTENLFIHHSAATYPLNADLKVEQGFIASRNNLKGLELRFKKINDSEHPVQISLKPGSISEKIAQGRCFETSFLSSDIEYDKFYRFSFPPITDSLNKSYVFSLRGEVATESASISPIISSLDIYLQGEAYVNGEQQPGDVMFKPVYHVSLFRLLGFYLNKIAFGKPVVFGKIPLLLVVLGLAGSLLILGFLIGYQAALVVGDKKEILKALLILMIFLIFLLILFYLPEKNFTLSAPGSI